MKKKIDLVMVLYNPDLKCLGKNIHSIYNQVDDFIIVDNSDLKEDVIRNREFVKEIGTKIVYSSIGENKGIAYGQNRGISISKKYKSDLIILSDQDTFYPTDYVEKMIIGINSVIDKFVAIVPLFKDLNQNRENMGFIKKTYFGYKSFYPKKNLHQIYHAISSGMVIVTKYLNDIGLFNEKLFIDWVDYEWCWRAVKKNYKIYGNADVVIDHNLGDGSKKLGYKIINTRSPIRHYYITRNAFYLATRCKSLNFTQKISLFFRSFRYFLYPIISKPVRLHLKYVLSGFFDGLFGRMGKYNKNIKRC